MTDKRLKPKERKHIKLWQLYLWWTEMIEMRKRHTLRIKAAERGKSNMSPIIERDFMEALGLNAHVSPTTKADREGSIFQAMVDEGQKVGPIWDWLVSHKGIGERLAAPLIAQVDDIDNFDTIAKLWRFAGYGLFDYWVDDKGKAICPVEGWKWTTIKGERYRVWTVVTDNPDDHPANGNGLAIPQNSELPPVERVDYIEPDPDWSLKRLSDRMCTGYHSPYNKTLKSILWNIMDSFVKQQTPYYSELYYSEKDRLREKHPEPVKMNGKTKYNPGHIDNMAKRKVKKEFLKQLWLKWREFEGLPVTEPY